MCRSRVTTIVRPDHQLGHARLLHTARPQPTSGGDLEPAAQKQSRRVVNHVYLLESSTTRRTYVGFSTEPLRRLKQHNGLAKGGAAPAGGRPWRLLLFVSGFNSKTSALAFEWAWHFPTVRPALLPAHPSALA